MIWTAIVALVVIKAYWFTYASSIRLSYFKIVFPGYEGLRPGLLDMLIIAAAGVFVGLFLSDVKEMLYGYVTAMASAFIVSVVYVTLYIWYVLEFGSVFGAVAYDWEWAVYIALSVVFTLMFPWIIGVCLASLAFGAFLRTWLELP
jgi:hypothetical protein